MYVVFKTAGIRLRITVLNYSVMLLMIDIFHRKPSHIFRLDDKFIYSEIRILVSFMLWQQLIWRINWVKFC